MKTTLLHSSRIGSIAMIVTALVGGAIGTLYALSEPGQESLPNLVYLAWFPFAMMAPMGLPVLIVIVALITWRQTRKLSIDKDTKEAKKQLMFSVWVSTAIATLPFLLLTLILFILTLVTPPKNPGDSTGLGMGMFFSMLCMFWNLFLIIIVGLFSRLLVTKEKAEQVTVI